MEPNECTHAQYTKHWELADLDLCHYAGKWKAAVIFAHGSQTADTFEWRMAARRHYLELGGCYVHERTAK